MLDGVGYLLEVRDVLSDVGIPSWIFIALAVVGLGLVAWSILAPDRDEIGGADIMNSDVDGNENKTAQANAGRDAYAITGDLHVHNPPPSEPP